MPNSNGWIISPNNKTKHITDSLPLNHDIFLSKSPEP